MHPVDAVPISSPMTFVNCSVAPILSGQRSSSQLMIGKQRRFSGAKAFSCSRRTLQQHLTRPPALKQQQGTAASPSRCNTLQAGQLARRPGICHKARAALAVRVRPPGLRAKCRQRWSSVAWCWRRSGAVGRCMTAVQGASMESARSEVLKGCQAALCIARIQDPASSEHCLLLRVQLDSCLAYLCAQQPALDYGSRRSWCWPALCSSCHNTLFALKLVMLSCARH